MRKSKMANRHSPEVRARAVRVVFEHQGSYETQAGAIAAIAPKIGCIAQTLSGWVKQAEKDSGKGKLSSRQTRRGSTSIRPVSSKWCSIYVLPTPPPSQIYTGKRTRRSDSHHEGGDGAPLTFLGDQQTSDCSFRHCPICGEEPRESRTTPFMPVRKRPKGPQRRQPAQ